eukprot:jgi/Galph1/4961/GphlegSOOS_G3649.1
MLQLLSDTLIESGVSWIFVGGKGGVGKTSTSASLAVKVAESGRPLLVISTDPAHNLSDIFSQQFSGQPTLVNGFDNLFAMEVDTSCLRQTEFKELLETLRGSSRNVLGEATGGNTEESQQIESFMKELSSSVPGIDEALAFASMVEYVENMKFDVVIFDTAPTGHTLRLLNFPNILERALEQISSWGAQFSGILPGLRGLLGAQGDTFGAIREKMEKLRKVTQKVINQFTDPRKTTFIAVCIPEFLPIYETERLLQELKKFHIDCKHIVVNHVIQRSLELGMKEEELFNARVKVQNKYLEEIRELYAGDFHVTKLPLLSFEIRGDPAIRSFAKLLLGAENPFYKESQKEEANALDIDEYPPTLQNVVEQQSLEWIFVGGKGGVGKTSISCALATLLSERNTNDRVLLVSTDPAHNLSDAFCQSFSSTPTAVQGNPRLDVMEISPNIEELMFQDEEFNANFNMPGFEGFGNVMNDLRSRFRDTFSDMISSIPGIDEAISFAHIMKFIRSTDYKVVVFDTAPTGHTVRLISFPSMLDKGIRWLSSLQEQYSPLLRTASTMMQSFQSMNSNNSNNNVSNNSNGPPIDLESLMRNRLSELKSNVENVQDQFRDSTRTTFICVAIAEFLSVYETERLVQELASCEIDCRNIVVNQLFYPQETQKKDMIRLRAEMQQKYLNQIDELYSGDFSVLRVPLQGDEVRGLDNLKTFSSYLELKD